MQKKLDYTKILQAKYFTGKNIPTYGTNIKYNVMHGIKTNKQVN